MKIISVRAPISILSPFMLFSILDSETELLEKLKAINPKARGKVPQVGNLTLFRCPCVSSTEFIISLQANSISFL